MGKHVVYLRTHDEAELRAQGHDPGEWVRDTIYKALGRKPTEPPLPGVTAKKAAEALTELARNLPVPRRKDLK